MIIAFNIFLAAICIVIMMPLLAFDLECLLAILPHRTKTTVPTVRHPRALVLIPAHNEESVLEQSLRVLIPSLSAGDRVLVVADNCDDRTAEVARAAGTEVAVRQDPARRGKGYALDFAVKYLRESPPEVVVILDADCLVSADTIRILAQQAFQSGRQVQALKPYRPPAADGFASSPGDSGESIHESDPAAGTIAGQTALPPDGHRIGCALAAVGKSALCRRQPGRRHAMGH